MSYPNIEANRAVGRVEPLCRALGVSVSGYYGQADAVVTMGRGEDCPVVPGALRENWDLPDPSGQPLETMRRVRDEIESRVKQLIAALCG